GFDHTPARLALAEAAIERAFRLRPDAGETHLAHARNLYHGQLDYGGALAELEVAQQTLPNDARIFRMMGYIQRRQGRWQESTQNLERASDLDPRNTETLQQIALSYGVLYRYADEKSVLERALAIEPNDLDTKIALAALQFHWNADTRSMHQTIDLIRTANSGAIGGCADEWLGRREEALREGRRAVELVPVEKDALVGPTMIKYLAMIAAWTGDKDLACEQLAIAVRPPSTVSYGQLKLLPFWDPLRGDPRFEKIVASVAPKEEANK